MEFLDHISSIQRDIKGGVFANEAQVSRGIVARLLDALGWPVYNVSVVYPEFPLQSRRVDYALCHPPMKPAAIIEVKAIGSGLESAEMQLFEYAFIAGIQLAVLTDGQDWDFYLPSGKGAISERRFYKLDLLERDPTEIMTRLTRYLSHEEIASGRAFKAAQEDHDSLNANREIEKAIPLAWHKLIEEQDSLLLEMIAEKVADICGHEPSLDLVGKFLHQVHTSQFLATPSFPQRQQHASIKQAFPTPVMQNSAIGYTLYGKPKTFGAAIDVLHSLLEDFIRIDPSFLSRFDSRKHGRQRRYVAQKREALYPGQPKFASYSRSLSNGWWMGTNYSRKNIMQIIELACDVAGITIGRDLTINLGE